MKEATKKTLLNAVGGSNLVEREQVQALWSGYGSIRRFSIENSEITSVIVKHIDLNAVSKHPRGWNSEISHSRKLKSYEVESAWYQNWSKDCTPLCRVPLCYLIERNKESLIIALEDLDQCGFGERQQRPSMMQIKSCLSWLAHFHATFLGKTPQGLWETGTYWHLECRPEELKALSDVNLKAAAKEIDKLLSASPFQTFVHGDAKVANFCFGSGGVAAVDFQYVGGGCGVKDVAYFLGSCLSEEECERRIPKLLSYYFDVLSDRLVQDNSALNIEELIENWNTLFPVAWADFHRFLKGWSPGHWKLNSYSERVTREVVEKIRTENLEAERY